MTTTSSLMREKFDPERTFVALKVFDFAEHHLVPGQTFPRDATTTRKLRQLYDARYVGMTAAPKHSKILDYLNGISTELSLMSIDELKTWLGDRGVVPRYGASRVQLLERAEKVRAAEQAAPPPAPVAEAAPAP